MKKRINLSLDEATVKKLCPTQKAERACGLDTP